MKNILTLALVLLALACDRVTTPDGTVPAEYLGIAANYQGSYKGSIEGVRGSFSLTLEGNRPVMAFTSERGDSDVLGGNCDSVIKNLVAINPDKKNNQIRVDSAEFALDSGRCNVASKVMLVDFRHSGLTPTKAYVSILVGYETYWRQICFPDGQGRQHCRREPESVPVYYQGSFTKI